jgi:hypothetical protein
MALLPPLPKSSDEQVEWFHALAEDAATGTLDATSVELTGHLVEFIALHIPGHELPPAMTTAEMASAVGLLRDNERSWNRALTNAIIQANERAEAGFSQAAARDLRGFAAQCPWKLFSQVATNQAQCFDSQRS